MVRVVSVIAEVRSPGWYNLVPELVSDLKNIWKI